MPYHILCIDDKEPFLNSLKITLKSKYQISTALSFNEAVQIIKKDPVDLILLDVNLGGVCGVELIHKLKELDPLVTVIMLSGNNDASLIVKAMKEGASDYLCKPYPTEELVLVIEKNLSQKSREDRSNALIEYCNTQKKPKPMIGQSQAMQELYMKSKKLRGRLTSVLIEGESGTGKEVLARHIADQDQSDNANRPFIAVNCAAIPETLLESELFGHEKGAFTGALRRKIGKFELADGGDLFLDEINSLRPELQAKLLRVLQEKEFYRVGGTHPVQVKIRVIASSNASLGREVKAGRFRQDLYFRLRVISFMIPPLRERLEDLEDLINSFLNQFSKGSKTISDKTIRILKVYPWPGNIRELKNLLESLVVMSPGSVIMPEDLPDWLRFYFETPSDSVSRLVDGPALNYNQIDQALKDYLRRKEVEYIQSAIEAYEGNVSKTAKILKVSRSTIYNALHRGGEPRSLYRAKINSQH